MSALTRSLPGLLPLASLLLVARPAAGDIAPSEAFVAPVPVQMDMSNAAPDDDTVELVALTATLDLYPTAARTISSALLTGPRGARRLGFPASTAFLRLGALAELEVRVDGREVDPERVDELGPRARDVWWSWPVELAGSAPLRVEVATTQAASRPERDDHALHLYGYLQVDRAAPWQGGLRDLRFILRLHGIPRELVTTPIPPTREDAGELEWVIADAASGAVAVGARVELPLGSLPGRSVTRASYLPDDAPDHLVIHDYVARFALACEAPTTSELEALVDQLHGVAARSPDPVAQAWASAALAELAAWCRDDEAPFEIDEAPPPVDAATERCLEWVGGDPAGLADGPRLLADPPACWDDGRQLGVLMRDAASRPLRRRLALAAAALASLVAAGVVVWVRRRRRVRR